MPKPIAQIGRLIGAVYRGAGHLLSRLIPFGAVLAWVHRVHQNHPDIAWNGEYQVHLIIVGCAAVVAAYLTYAVCRLLVRQYKSARETYAVWLVFFVGLAATWLFSQGTSDMSEAYGGEVALEQSMLMWAIGYVVTVVTVRFLIRPRLPLRIHPRTP